MGRASRVQTSSALTADGAVIAGAARLMGYSVRETAAAVATLTIRDGSSTSGAPRAVCNLAASASYTVMFGPEGLDCPNGIFVDLLTGAVSITVNYAQ